MYCTVPVKLEFWAAYIEVDFTLFLTLNRWIRKINIYEFLPKDKQSITPKYLQIVNTILHEVEVNDIIEDYLLPSVNNLSFELEISGDTAEKVLRYLKSFGLIGSVWGKDVLLQTLISNRR